MSITANTLKSMCFADSVNGYIAGNWGTIIKTTDGGNSWMNMPTGSMSLLKSVYFVNAKVGYAVGDSYLKTTDGGKSWTENDELSYLYVVYFLDANTGYIGESGYILKTTTGGEPTE